MGRAELAIALGILLAAWVPAWSAASFVAGYQVQKWLTSTNGAAWMAIDNSSHLWTSDFSSQSLSRYDPNGTLVSRTFLSNPTGSAIAIDGFGNLWTPSGSGDYISKIDGNGNFIGNYSCVGFCVFVTVDLSNNIWVTEQNNGVVLYTNTGVLEQNFSVCSFAYAIALDSGGNILVTCPNDDSIVQIDPVTNLTLNNWYIGYSAYYLAIDKQGNIFTANVNPTSVTKFNSTGSLLWTNTGFEHCNSLAIDEQGRIWVADIGAGLVVVLNNTDGNFIHNFTLEIYINDIIMDSQSNFYVSLPSSNVIYKLVAPTASPTLSPTQSPLPVVTGYILIPLPPNTNCAGYDVDSGKLESFQTNASACASLCTRNAGSGCIGFTFLSDPNNLFYSMNCFPKFVIILSV